MSECWDDEELMDALGRALRARQAVPAEFMQAGKNAFAWRDIGIELAQLTYDSDSVTARDRVAGTRAESASIRSLAFSSAHLTIELEVTSSALLGQIVPARAATIAVQGRTGAEIVVAADEIGCFSIEPAPREPFRLRCRTADSLDVITGWATL